MEPFTGRRRNWRLIGVAASVAALLVFGLAACGDDEDGDNGGAGEVQQARFVIPFSESIAFVGLVLAQDRFYAEDGLDVETVVVDGCGAVPQVLIPGREKYALLCVDSTMIAEGQGDPMRQIALINRNVFVIEVPVDSDIEAIADLEGRTLGITEFSGGEVGLVSTALDGAGLDSRIEGNEDVEMKVVGPGGPAAYNALRTGEIDAYAGATNDLAAMQPLGLESRTILPEDLQQLPTSGLAVMQETLDNEEDREIAIKIARGWLKGNQFAIENPDEALQVVCERIPAECRDMEVAQAYMDRTIGTITPPEGLRPGEQGPLDLYEIVEQGVISSGDLESEVDLEEIFPNTYLDELNEGL